MWASGKARLLAGAALGMAVAGGASSAADARPAHRIKARRPHAAAASPLTTEVEALRAQVAALTARLDAQAQLQAQVQAAPPPAQSGEAVATASAEMQSQIEDLQGQLSDIQQAQAVQVGQRPAVVTLPNGRPTFATADGNFTVNFHGVGQFDTAVYLQDKGKLPSPPFDQRSRDLNSGTNFRRARIGFDGKVFGDFDYSFLYEAGGSGAEDAAHIHEIWAQYSGWKPWHIKIGAFEPLIGLNANISTNSIPFLERASPAEVSRNVAAGDSRSAIQFWGNDDFNFGFGGTNPKTHWLLSAAVTGNTVSTLNSTGGFATQPFDEQLAYIGRLAIAPYGPDWTLHLGVHGQRVEHVNDSVGSQNAAVPAIGLAGRFTATLQDRPELRVDGTRLVTTGALNADHVTEFALEGGLQWKSFFAQSELFSYQVEKNAAGASSPHFNGWYVEGSYLLTGEQRLYAPANGAFSNVTPAHNFNLAEGGWGAFEIAARYSDLDLNYREGARGAATPTGGVRGGDQQIVSLALDWYSNPTIRFILQGQNVKIDRLTGAGLSLGQEYQTLEVRSQVAF